MILMKPLNLVMQNFGSYNGKQELDFTKLEDIFLITGKTGSGKTTIFDAVVFALYGKPLGTRTADDLFTSFLPEEGVMSVIFRFSVKGDEYEIERIHKRYKKRNGDINDKTDQIVRKKEGDLFQPLAEVSKKSEITAFISNLLHLTWEEFSRIIVLPQGEFQKFLEQDSRERQSTLEKLFPVDQHGRVTDYFKSEKNLLVSRISGISGRIEDLEGKYDYKNWEKESGILQEQIDSAHKGLIKQRRIRDNLIERKAREESVMADFSTLRGKQEEAVLHSADKDRITEHRKRLERYREYLLFAPYLSQYRSVTLEVEEAESHLKTLKVSLEQVKERKREVTLQLESRSRFQDEKEQAISEKGKMQPLLEKEKERIRLEKELQQHQEELEAEKQVFNTVDKTLRDLKESMDSTKKSIEEGNMIIAGEVKLLTEQHYLLKVQNLLETYKLLQDQLSASEKEQSSLARTVLINEREYKDLRQQKEESVTATVAALLENGKPCPVCGSVDHPHPANLDIEEFTDTQRLDAAEQNYGHSVNALEVTRSRITELRKQAVDLEQEIKGHDCGLDTDLEGINARCISLQVEIGTIEEARLSMDRSSRELLQYEQRVMDLESEREKSATRISKIEETLSTVQTLITSINKDLGDTSDIATGLNLLEKRLRELDETIDAITKEEQSVHENYAGITASIKSHESLLSRLKNELASSRDLLEAKIQESGFNDIDDLESESVTEADVENLSLEVESYEERGTRLKVEVEQLLKKTQGMKEPDIETTVSEINRVEQDIEARSVELEQISLRHNELVRIHGEHELLLTEKEKIERESAVLMELASDLSGDNEKRINFQNYVLNSYLQRVTRHADRRINVLSDGRYNFLVKSTRQDKRHQAGLDLDIIDSFTMTSRSVKTLSGGEKFLASISLALGLSDAIQERAGQVEMDSLFLDEGFGALDEEALNRALNILDDIRTNRMIGVISHVPELKQRIPCQVLIEKSSSGSSINIRS
jgi:exonuclease SbcC